MTRHLASMGDAADHTHSEQRTMAYDEMQACRPGNE